MEYLGVHQGRGPLDCYAHQPEFQRFVKWDFQHTAEQPGDYVKDLEGLIQYGASPRATINLTLAAKANAFLDGRGYVVPQDVKDVAMDILRHRVILTYEAEAEEKKSEDVIKAILDHVPVP